LSTGLAEENRISCSLHQKVFGSVKKQRQLLALLLFALTLLVYNPASRFQFLNFDDPQYITENSHVQQGLHVSTLRWALTTFDFFNWHPLTWISYLVDYRLFRLNPAGYHFMNVVYHAIAAVLLFVVLHHGTERLLRSFSVAILFALHPLNIESVAWISERKNVLSAIFWFLAIWAYGWYALRPGWKRYFIVVACFALALMCKPMVITLPCVLLLADIWPLGRTQWCAGSAGVHVKTEFRFSRKSGLQLVLEKVPLLIMSGASAVLTFLSQKYNGGIASTNAYPIDIRIKNAVLSYALYLWKTFLPLKLAIFYPHPGRNIPFWKVFSSAMFLIGITAAVWRERKRRPYLLVCWLSFLGTLVPVIGLLQNGDQAMANRYAYTPLIGIFMMLVWRAAEWFDRSRPRRVAAVAVATVVLAALIVDLRNELPNWSDSIAVFSRALSVTTRNDLAENNLGEALASQGRETEAAVHFVNAVRYNPNEPRNRYNFARSLLLAGRPREAIEEFNAMLELHPPQVVTGRAYRNMALAYLRIGKRAEAKSCYEAAEQLDPDDPYAYLMLGLLEFEDHEIELARKNLEQSSKLLPTDIAYFVLGTIWEQQGRLPEARAAYAKAALQPSSSADLRRSLEAIQNKLQWDNNSVATAPPTVR
jgi:tetratricopeptide (TPR) repeat protein